MLQLDEHIQYITEALSTEFTDDDLELADSYSIKYLPELGVTHVELYDYEEKLINSVDFEDADVAIETLKFYFDIDDEDLADLDNYKWATE